MAMKDIFFLIIGLIVIVGSVVLFLQSPRTSGQKEGIIRIGENEIRVEIADNDEERSMGLSDRGALLPGYGMLFVFDTPGSYGFWMKNMKFPIDIIWIDENSRIIGIEKSVQPETYPNVFYPPSPVKYVLELPAGFADLHKINAGSMIQ